MSTASPTRPFVLLLTVALAGGCGDGTVSQPDGIGVTGTWTFVVDVTVATDACAGEENDPVATAIVAMVEDDGEVTARSAWFADSGTHTFTGTRTGNTVSVTGSYAEDGGTTTATYELTVRGDEQQMTGVENWNWVSGSQSCPGSQSDVTATRN